MHTIGNYLFDSDRLIIYRSDMDKQTLDTINVAFKSDVNYESVLSSLTSINSDEMRMNKIAINSIGTCLTYNCNLRCN